MEADTWICPGCGTELRVGVRGCPKCSRPERRKKRRKQLARRSWEQDLGGDGLDLPDEDFDYDDFVAREFGKMPHRKVPIAWYWWVTAILLIVTMVWWLF